MVKKAFALITISLACSISTVCSGPVDNRAVQISKLEDATDVSETPTVSEKTIITFDANGGKLSGNKILVVDKTAIFSSFKDNCPTATREGASSNPGWYYLDKGTHVPVDDNTSFPDDVTLYANWKTYTVHFFAGDGGCFPETGYTTASVYDATIVHADMIGIPVRNDAVFTHFTIDGEKLNFPLVLDEKVASANIVAQYTTKVCTVCFKSNFKLGNVYQPGTFQDGSTVKFIQCPYGTYLNDKTYFSSVLHPTYIGTGEKKERSDWFDGRGYLTDYTVVNRDLCLSAYYDTKIEVGFYINEGKWSDGDTSTYKQSDKFFPSANKTFKQIIDAMGENKLKCTKTKTFTSAPTTGTYAFKYWAYDQDGLEMINENDVITSSARIYAIYDEEFEFEKLQVSEGGGIYPDKWHYKKDEERVLTINLKQGYSFENYKIHYDGSHTGLKPDPSTYSFAVDPSNPLKGYVTIKKAFYQNTDFYFYPSKSKYTITKQYDEGIASFECDDTACYKDVVYVKIKPKTGYSITSLKVVDENGKTLLDVARDTGNFTMPTANVVVSATTEKAKYAVAPKEVLGEGIETILLSKSSDVEYGDEVVATAIPKAGYSVTAIKVYRKLSETIYASNELSESLTFSMPSYDCEVDATAAEVIHKVNFDTNGGDTASFFKDVKYNQKVSKPVNPTKSGSVFGGWYTSKEFKKEQLFDFENSIINSDVTLYARWYSGEIKITYSNYNIDIDSTTPEQFNLVIGSEVVDHDVTWSSDNENIATISAAGVLTPKDAGHCFISATFSGKSVATDDFEIGSFSKLHQDYLPYGLIWGKDKYISGKVYVPARYHNGTEFIDLKFVNDDEVWSVFPDEGSFKNCEKITYASIAEGIYKIGCYGFRKCSSMTQIKLPESLTKICAYGFYKCSALNSIRIPKNVNKIGLLKLVSYTFTYCDNLQRVIVDSETIAQMNNPGNDLYSPLSDGKIKIILVPKDTIIGNTIWLKYNKIKSDETYDYYQQA